MTASINRAALTQTSFDSAAPSGAATVVHRFAKEGRYAAVLVDDAGERVETRTILVSPVADLEGGPAPVPGLLAMRAQGGMSSVLVDVSATASVPGRQPPAAEPATVHSLGTDGYAAFSGAIGRAHRVVVTRIGADGEQEEEFDSERMRTGDAFAVTLLRPGTYGVKNALGGQEARAVVTYPVLGRTPYRPAEPVVIELTEAGFQPDSVTIGPGQGMIFQSSTESRITVDLLEPDDGGPEATKRSLARRRLRRPPPGGEEQLS